jgi:DNA (cytosine-5)-methyltransferase 1
MGQRRDSATISNLMRRVKSRDTKPEVAFRKALWARGLRYRICDDALPGKPDLVFPRYRLAVFIDGDFWHGYQWQRRGLSTLEDQFRETPSKDYWVRKITRNVARDEARTSELAGEGWRVLRFWESDLKQNLSECVAMTVKAARGGEMPLAQSGIPEKTFADFFAGIGLVRLALESRGWTHVFSNDIDPKKFEMYAENFRGDPPATYILADIYNLCGDDIPTVMLAHASFPCTDLSLAGARAGLAGKHSGTLWALLRILGEMGSRRPMVVMLENVTGFLTSHGGSDFRRAIAALNELSYVCDAFVVDAVHFVPQSRPRLFVIGALDASEPLTTRDGPVFYESHVRPRELAASFLLDPKLRWRIRELPALPQSTHRLDEILEDLPSESTVWWDDGRTKYLLSQMSERHAAVARTMIAADEYTYGTVYRRIRHGRSMAELRTDGIAGCLRTPRGGSSRQILLKAGRGQCRARFLTPREYARLQGVPDTFPITVTNRNQAYFGFGDAVCVPVVQWIADNYLNPLVTDLLRGRLLKTGSG